MDGDRALPMEPPPPTDGEVQGSSESTKPRDSKGWDGKARVERRAIITNPEALSDLEYSDEDAPPVQQINADEGGSICVQALSRPR